MSVTFTFPYQSWKSFCGQPFCSLTLGLELDGLAQPNSILATSPSGLQEFRHLSFFFSSSLDPYLSSSVSLTGVHRFCSWEESQHAFCAISSWGGGVVFEPFLGRIGTLSLLALGLAGQVLCDRLADMCAVQSSGRGPSSKVPSTSETPTVLTALPESPGPWTLPPTPRGGKSIMNPYVHCFYSPRTQEVMGVTCQVLLLPLCNLQ